MTSTHRLHGSGPEPFEACPDGGRCWHDCPLAEPTPEHPEGRGTPCWRVNNAVPMREGGWTDAEREAHTPDAGGGRVTPEETDALAEIRAAVTRADGDDVRLALVPTFTHGTCVQVEAKAIGARTRWRKVGPVLVPKENETAADVLRTLATMMDGRTP